VPPANLFAVAGQPQQVRAGLCACGSLRRRGETGTVGFWSAPPSPGPLQSSPVALNPVRVGLPSLYCSRGTNSLKCTWRRGVCMTMIGGDFSSPGMPAGREFGVAFAYPGRPEDSRVA
jgi:hypothetical protein